MKYEREGGKYNYYVLVAGKYSIELLHPLQLQESDKVLFETINKKQWYDFIYYCMTKYNINVINYEDSPSELKALWDEFNNNGSI